MEHCGKRRGDALCAGAKARGAHPVHRLSLIHISDLVPALWRKVEVISEDTVRVWAAGIDYIVGDEVAYPDASGTMYTCNQAHTSQTGWEPPVTPALWTAQNESGDDASPDDDTGLMNDEGQTEEA